MWRSKGKLMVKPRSSKKYQAAASLVDASQFYGPEEAVELAKKTSTAAFDETVELHLRTNADPRHADQQLRGMAVLPHGLGKPVRVLVFTQGELALAAQQAGAEYVGDDDLISQIEGGWADFDVAIATPDMMTRIGKLGRLLGRRGLMPNPRTGTVVQPDKLVDAIEEAKRGRVELRIDRTAIIHSPIGKVSFEEEHLLGNLVAVMDTLNQLKPTGVKGAFIKTGYLTTTMGPSIPLDLASITGLRLD